MRRLLIAIVVVLAFCAMASPALAAFPIRIADPTGDAANVPDVVGLTIEDVGAGFAFTIELGTMQDLLPNALIGVFIDVDRNAQTGADGAEFLLIADSQELAIGRWNGTNFAEFQGQPTNPSLQNGRLAFTMAKSDLGSTKFDVTVFAVTTGGEGADRAPDNAPFTYLPSITRLVIPSSAGSIRAGAILTARTVQAQLTPVPGQTVNVRPTLRCVLSYRGRAIRALAGGCRWRIPKAWRGRRLTLRITATVGTETRTQTVTVRVR